MEEKNIYKIEFKIENELDIEKVIFNAIVIELGNFKHRSENVNYFENIVQIQNDSIDKMKNLLEQLKYKMY